MDLWWLVVGAMMLALGSTFAAMARDVEIGEELETWLAKLDDEDAGDKAVSSGWEGNAAMLLNSIGAYVVAAGALLSLVGDRIDLVDWIAVGVFFVFTAALIFLLIRSLKSGSRRAARVEALRDRLSSK